MVSLPAEFVATRYPGYFWNTKTRTLYSLKVDGILKELKLTYPNHFNRFRSPAYRVSVRGHRRNMFVSVLKHLTVPNNDSEIPVRGE